jgi:hypothetical protein
MDQDDATLADGLVPSRQSGYNVDLLRIRAAGGRIWWAHFEFTRINIDVITTSTSLCQAGRDIARRNRVLLCRAVSAKTIAWRR